MSEIICNNERNIWESSEMKFGPFKMLPSLKFELLESDIKEGFSEGKIVLEYGCGMGVFIEELSKSMYNNKYFGTDISRIEIKDVAKKNTRVKYFISDAMSMPLKDSSVDVLLFLDFMEHLNEPEKVFLEAKRVLKNDGIIHLDVPVEANKSTIFWIFTKIFRKNLQKRYCRHIHSYSLNDVKNLLHKQQFKITNLNYHRHFIGQLAQFSFFFAKFFKDLLSIKEDYVKIIGIDKSFVAGLKDEYSERKNKEKFKLNNLFSVKFYFSKIYYLFRIFQNLLLVAAYYESKILKNFSFVFSKISARIVKTGSQSNIG